VYVNSTVPAKTTKELIEYAKANPGKLNFSSSGTGGLQHFAGEMFNHLAKVKMVHVPFKGSAAGIIANLAGEVQVGFGTLFGVRPHWESGRFRVLAMTDSKRSPAVPNIPTVAESGVPGYEVDQWYGIIGGTKIPKPVINKIRDAIATALKDPVIIKRLARDGSTPVGSTPAEFTKHIQSEVNKWRKLAKDAGLQLH
jgi:tripartite-type tricarboxylate transporter receptor subunit TctC